MIEPIQYESEIIQPAIIQPSKNMDLIGGLQSINTAIEDTTGIDPGAGGLIKNLFYKGTIIGNLLGSKRPKPSKTMTQSNLFDKLGVSGGLTFGKREANIFVIAVLVIVGTVITLVSLARKRKRKRR